MLHIVDLDGAFLGKLKNLAIVKDIIEAVNVPVELGGGLRSEGEVEQALSCGVKRVILGTRAYNDENFIKRLIKKYPEAICVSVDTAKGEVISEGWRTQTSIRSEELLKRFSDIGIKAVIYTDILKDGTMESPNYDNIEDVLSKVTCNVIISGGIGSLDDIKTLKALGKKNLEGIIIGKALYEGIFTLREANEVVGGIQ